MLQITTPNAQGATGQSKLDTYTFSGKDGRKFFTIDNGGSSETVTLTLVNDSPITGGLTGGFRLFPGGTAGEYITNVTMPPSNNMSFSIDYDKDWGDSLQAKLYASTNIHTYDETFASTGYVLIGPTSSITFNYKNSETITRRDLGSLLCQDSEGNYQISQNSLKITEDETSFGLVRTNPKLTGNVKLTVDSKQDIWLNSIDAEKELADDRYKKYRIGKNASYASDLNRFFDLGNTPPELVFSLYQQDTQYTSSKRNFSEQYDKFYQYGVSELKSKFYDEDFSFFAPLYLKNEIPDNFVIFRTNGPVNSFSYQTSFDDWKNYVTPEILANSQIIKTYSLAEDTSIGMYLRSIVNHPSRTETDLTVSYQTNGYTYYNGISYQKGSFSQMGELLYEYYNEENPLMSVEEFITLGFERNKVISSHVINLEFLFDDTDATNYTINRYFGLYVNTIDLAKFTMSEQGLQLFSREINQTPFPRKGVDGNKISQKSFTQTNPDGISVFIDTSSIERITPIDSTAFSAPVFRVDTDMLQTLTVSLEGNYLPRLNVGDLFTMSDGIIYETSHVVTGLNYDNNITTVNLNFSTAAGSTSLAGITGMNLNCSFYDDVKYSNFVDEIFNNEFIQSQPRFFYLKDNVGNLHSINSTETKYFGGVDTFEDQKVIQAKLKDTVLDISSFGGFSNLLTQTEAVVLNEKGKASISVEVLSYFSPNDYIEITWNSPSANIGYPLRWRAIANDSMLNPGEHWPTFAIDTDSEGEYYVSYFHTGDSSVKLSQVVKSISDTFNVFPFKDFDILAKDSFLHFRSTQDGRSSETAQIRISTDIPNMKINGTPASTSGIVNFIGGSERKRTRCKVRTSIAQGMLIDEYISTVGSFSLPRVYDVLGSRLVFSSYLEEPVYDILGNLIDFKGVDEFKIVCIEDESSTIQHTSDNKITTYELFKPSYGILSIMPLRDFDTDFFYSDYTKSYTPELIRYFERAYAPVKVQSVFSSLAGDIYTFDKEIDPNFSSSGATALYLPYLVITDSASTPQLHNEDSQFLYTGGLTATLLTAPGTSSLSGPVIDDIVLFLPEEKHMFFSDSELSKFKGFLSLSGVVSTQDEDTFKSLENQWDPTRFIFQNINSEYERLEENYLKSLVLKSRVVPYISKWVSPQGKDIRDNNYRLNYHRSFGNTNFSPSAEISIPDPRYHTHEWPYLDSVPDEFPTAKYPDQMFSYMFDRLSDTYDFSSIKKDWFSDYFTVGYPCEKYLDNNGNFVSANIEPSEKYAYFNYQNYDDTTQALFRGYKIGIRELDSVGIPVNLSTKYNNYKFSVIIETREDDSYLEEEPLTYKTIVNEKWKFILIKITLRISSYRYTTGNVSYVDLYTMYNNDEIATFVYDPAQPSTLQSYQRAIPEDKKLSVGINFTAASLNVPLTPGLYYFDSFNFTGSSYIVDLKEELKPLSDGVFSRIVGTNTFGNVRTTISTKKTVKSVFLNNTIELDDNRYSAVKSNIAFSSTLVLGTGSSLVDWNNTILYHQGGGNASGSGIRERLTFSEIVKVINGTSSKSIMLYEIYDVDGNVSYPTSDNLLFSMYTISPEALTRIYDYFPVSDPDKPQEFYTNNEIGAVLSQQKDLQTIYRYQGNFSPKFRDVLKFWVREDDKFTNVASRDFLLNNTRIGDNFLNFSTLRNQYYTKVSDQEILKISTDSGYQPVYPLINEIVIDKKDEFAWSSSWDNLYYRKYTTAEAFNDIKGTQEMKEVKSMLGSKAMKVPKQYDLYEYNITKSTILDLSSYINDEFVYYEDSSTAYLQINVYKRLLREMLGTDTDYRAKTEFLKALDLLPSSIDPIFDPLLIDDYVKQYLEKNVLDLFEISDIKLYVLQTGNPAADSIVTITPKSEYRPLIESTNVSGTSLTLSESVLLNKGYIKQKDTSITNVGNMIFQIKYPLDSRFYTSLSVGVAVKRI